MGHQTEPTYLGIARSIAHLQLIQRKVGELTMVRGLPRITRLIQEAQTTPEAAQERERAQYLAVVGERHRAGASVPQLLRPGSPPIPEHTDSRTAPTKPVRKRGKGQQLPQSPNSSGQYPAKKDLLEIAWELELLNHDLYRDD